MPELIDSITPTEMDWWEAYDQICPISPYTRAMKIADDIAAGFNGKQEVQDATPDQLVALMRQTYGGNR